MEGSLEYTCRLSARPVTTTASNPREAMAPLTVGAAPSSFAKAKDTSPCGLTTLSLCSPAGNFSRVHCPS